METFIKIEITLESIVPTNNSYLAERILLNRLRIALKKCETVAEIREHFRNSTTVLDYLVTNEAVKRS